MGEFKLELINDNLLHSKNGYELITIYTKTINILLRMNYCDYFELSFKDILWHLYKILLCRNQMIMSISLYQ